MKNNIIFAVIFLLIPAACGAGEPGEGRFPSEWLLIGADAVIAGLTAYAVIDQMDAAGRYEDLKKEIDGTTEANYYRLLYEREKSVGKENVVLISSAALGAALLYTGLDFFWLHNFFPAGVKTAVVPAENGVKFAINGGF